jgi:hypothetical protein
MEEQKQSIPVLIIVDEWGKKEVLAISNGY